MLLLLLCSTDTSSIHMHTKNADDDTSHSKQSRRDWELYLCRREGCHLILFRKQEKDLCQGNKEIAVILITKLVHPKEIVRTLPAVITILVRPKEIVHTHLQSVLITPI